MTSPVAWLSDDHAEHRCAPTREAAAEIRGSPGERRREAQDAGAETLDQGRAAGPDAAGTLSGFASSPSIGPASSVSSSADPGSTSVGPGSSTTWSATSSYRSEVVR